MDADDIDKQIARLKALKPFVELREAARLMKDYAEKLETRAADSCVRISNDLDRVVDAERESPTRAPRSYQPLLWSARDLRSEIEGSHESASRRFSNAVTDAMQTAWLDTPFEESAPKFETPSAKDAAAISAEGGPSVIATLDAIARAVGCRCFTTDMVGVDGVCRRCGGRG